MYGGYEEWAEEVIFLSGEAKYQRIGFNFEEMAFDSQDARNETRILGPFGVPPILVGSRIGLERSTYSNYETARQAFWEDTMVPETMLFQVDYQYFLQGAGGEFVAFDYSKVPALQEIADERHKLHLEDYKAAAIMKNEYRKLIGFDPVPGGDVFVIVNQAGSLAQSVEVDTGESTADGAPEATDDLGKRKKVPAR